jgi:hypothetical protein
MAIQCIGQKSELQDCKAVPQAEIDAAWGGAFGEKSIAQDRFYDKIRAFGLMSPVKTGVFGG